jgi:DNA invertase Pin-like site-specific DNA recombinase
VEIKLSIYRQTFRSGEATENQRIALIKLAVRRGFEIVHEYEHEGISGGKGRDMRPAFDQMLKDAMRRRVDVCSVWPMERFRARPADHDQIPAPVESNSAESVIFGTAARTPRAALHARHPMPL